ncbi:MAG: hypothetical protein WCX81_01665 [Monoglobales bacterium]
MSLKTVLTDKKNLPIFIILICALSVFAFFGGDKPAAETKVKEGDPAYLLEKRLERVLEKVTGAGNVSVFVSLDDYGATDYAKDSREVIKEKQSESEHTTVMKGSGSAAAPVVTRMASPKVKGVIVVAEGADNAVVKENLAAAVEASLGIMPHRIKILEGNK